MKPTRTQFIAGLAAAATLRTSAAEAQDSSLRLGGGYSDLGIEPFVALEAGFFGKAGLNVEVTPFTNSSTIVAAVAGGSLDAGLADMTQIANAVNRGLPFAFFAGSSLYSAAAPVLALCAAKNGSIKTAKDLENQTLAAISLKSITEASIREWLRVNGADPGKVRLIEMAYPEMAPALDRGTVAAAYIGEPFLTSAKDTVRVIGHPYDVVGSSFYVSAWFATRTWLSQNAELARRATEALNATAVWANGHHNESAVILAKYSKLDLNTIRAMTRTTYATALDPKLMQPVLDISEKYQLIEKHVVASDLIARLTG